MDENGRSGTMRTGRRTGRRTVVIGAAGAVALAVGASFLQGGGAGSSRPASAPPLAQADAARPAGAATTDGALRGPGATPASTSSPYAVWVVIARAGDIAAIDPVSGRVKILAVCGSPCGPPEGLTLSPDGQLVAYLYHGVPPAGTPVQRARASAEIAGIAFARVDAPGGTTVLPGVPLPLRPDARSRQRSFPARSPSSGRPTEGGSRGPGRTAPPG